ncbi:MAG TPA: hypothetical protein VGM73_03705 [Candidatus Didemnitutus sp.]|jgi:hypothetical protein
MATGSFSTCVFLTTSSINLVMASASQIFDLTASQPNGTRSDADTESWNSLFL